MARAGVAVHDPARTRRPPRPSPACTPGRLPPAGARARAALVLTLTLAAPVPATVVVVLAPVLPPAPPLAPTAAKGSPQPPVTPAAAPRQRPTMKRSRPIAPPCGVRSRIAGSVPSRSTRAQRHREWGSACGVSRVQLLPRSDGGPRPAMPCVIPAPRGGASAEGAGALVRSPCCSPCSRAGSRSSCCASRPRSSRRRRAGPAPGRPSRTRRSRCRAPGRRAGAAACTVFIAGGCAVRARACCRARGRRPPRPRWPWARSGRTPRRRCTASASPRAGSGRDRRTRCRS